VNALKPKTTLVGTRSASQGESVGVRCWSSSTSAPEFKPLEKEIKLNRLD